jgi:hypothetical protein
MVSLSLSVGTHRQVNKKLTEQDDQGDDEDVDHSLCRRANVIYYLLQGTAFMLLVNASFETGNCCSCSIYHLCMLTFLGSLLYHSNPYTICNDVISYFLLSKPENLTSGSWAAQSTRQLQNNLVMIPQRILSFSLTIKRNPHRSSHDADPGAMSS